MYKNDLILLLFNLCLNNVIGGIITSENESGDQMGANSRPSNNLDKKLQDLEKNIQAKLEDIDKKLNALQQNLPAIVKESMQPTLKEVEQFEKQVLKTIGGVTKYGCKEQVSKGYNFNTPLFRMDNATYNHIRRQGSGSTTNSFEMHIAIKAAQDGVIALSAASSFDYKNTTYEIVVGGNGNRNVIVRWKWLAEGKSVDAPNILSSTDYTLFYISIHDGILELGKEGDAPLITHSDDDLKQVQYFGFASWNNEPATFLYDCPYFDN